MRRLWGLVLVAAVLAASCVGSDTDPPAPVSTTTAQTTPSPGPTSVTTTTTPAPTPADVVLPSVLEIDTGALEVAPQPDTEDTLVDLITDLPHRETADDGVAFDVEECRLVAPGQWVFRGRIDAPEAAIGAELGLHLSFTEGDVVLVTPIRVTIRSSGEFAIPVDFIAISGIDGARPYSPHRDLADSCFTRVDRATTPVATFSDAAPTSIADTLEYEAPSNSLQALGIGADLGDPDDPRRSWAYATYQNVDIPFREVWLPANDVAEFVRATTRSDLCRSMESRITGTTVVRQSRDCDTTYDTMPSSVDGWELVDSANGGAYRRIGDIEVYVVDPEGDADFDELLEIATTLEPAQNALYRDPAFGSADLEEAIAGTLAADGWAERGRLTDGDRVFVAATTRDTAVADDRMVWHRLAVFEMIETSDGLWTQADAPGRPASSTTSCLISQRRATTDGRHTLAVVTAGNDWSLQHRTADGWQTLDSAGGVHIGVVDATAPRAEIRALDASGGVVRCATSGASLEAGEVWSTYRAPEIGGIDVEIGASGAIPAGSTVAVKGAGAYRKRNVEIRVCTAASTQWIDRMECGPALGTNTNSVGEFHTQLDIPATIATQAGATVDCRIEQCVIRVDTIKGIHRSGWVPITVVEET